MQLINVLNKRTNECIWSSTALTLLNQKIAKDVFTRLKFIILGWLTIHAHD